MGEKYTTREVIRAIQNTFGIKTAVAKALGCSRNTVDNYIKRHPTVALAYWAERERLVDMAEAKFGEAIKQGEWGAIRFCLSTLGKDRGFVERREIDQLGDMTITLEWDDGYDNDNETAAAPAAADDSSEQGEIQGGSGGEEIRQD